MGLIPDDTISEIRERSDIVAVIGRHVELKKAGRNHKGLCPFHQEKSPSFNVNGDKGYYYCFGCQQKGDVFSFVMEYEGKSFVEAAESLASQFGILIPEPTGDAASQNQRRSEKSQMLAINDLAREFYRGQLEGSSGEIARNYLSQRGIGAEESERFSLGYAPNEWRSLVDFLEARGTDLHVAEAVGLVVKQKNSGGYYDRFRDRLMCPIAKTGGEIVGFSGRTLGSEADAPGAKYINSPESLIYKKSKLLFGIHQARDAFREKGHAILVEGNFDVIRLHENGFRNVVAPLGTALTDDQALTLKRLTGQVYLLYDGDRAGRAATLRGLQTLLRQEVSVRIASLPAGEDPDSLIGSGGAAALEQVLSRSQPAVEYFIHEIWVRSDPSAEGRAKVMHESAQVLKNIKDPTQRDFAIGTFAAALGVDEATLRRGLRRAFQEDRARQRNTSDDANLHASPQRDVNRSPLDPQQLGIICLLAEYPELLSVAEEAKVFSLLTDMRLQEMYSAAKEGKPVLSVVSDSALAKALLDRNYSELSDPKTTFEGMIHTVRSVHKKREQERLAAQMEEAQRRGDREGALEIHRQIVAIRKQVD